MRGTHLDQLSSIGHGSFLTNLVHDSHFWVGIAEGIHDWLIAVESLLFRVCIERRWYFKEIEWNWIETFIQKRGYLIFVVLISTGLRHMRKRIKVTGTFKVTGLLQGYYSTSTLIFRAARTRYRRYSTIDRIKKHLQQGSQLNQKSPTPRMQCNIMFTDRKP